MAIVDALNDLRSECGADVTLVAVSKYSPIEAVREAYAAGQRDFGENKAQDISVRAAEMPQDAHWHFIGHLQRNKVKYIAPFIHLIHSVDSIRLLDEIEKQAASANRTIACLLQVHIANEDSKFGFSYAELHSEIAETDWSKYAHVQIIGLMGMASLTSDEAQIKEEFAGLKTCFDQLKNQELPKPFALRELSMGMSSDYLSAIAEGSTMVRIGSAIFK